MYVIERTDQGGGWVSAPGSEHSYTHDLRKARVYRKLKEAMNDRCDNEVVRNLEDLLHITD